MTDPTTLGRISQLAIPPVWVDVWICPWSNGHIQAIGTDAAGRRQYRYHDDWRLHRDRQKFDRVLMFAGSLPALRQVVHRDLGAPGLDRERVLAATCGSSMSAASGWVEKSTRKSTRPSASQPNARST